MPATFSLQVVTPDHTVYSGEIVSLVAPGVEGYVGVLAHHAPMLVGLAPGLLELTAPTGERLVYAITGGFLQVAANKAIVLADAAETPEEIDVRRAREALERAQARLQQAQVDIDVDRARAALMRALNRLRVAERFGRR